MQSHETAHDVGDPSDQWREHGLTPEELSHLGGAQLAAEGGAASADHLLHATEADIEALVEAGVTPVFLPGTAFGLGADYADPDPFLERDATVAVATDCNLDCLTESMGFAASLACVGMGMTPHEAVVAGTAGGADALDRSDGTGTLAEGAPGDPAVVDGPSHVHVPYRYGMNRVGTVVKGGAVVRGG